MTAPPDPVPRQVADALVESLRAVPGVFDVHSGAFGEVALLFPRHRVPGLRLSTRPPRRLEVHLVADLASSRPLEDVAAEIRRIVHEAVPGVPVDVVFGDATRPERNDSA